MEDIKNWRVSQNLLSNKKKQLKGFKYYVYIVVSPSKEVMYIGKGTKDRCLHTLSGTSSNYYLNRDHFLGIVHKVYIYDIFDSEQEALNVEEALQKALNPKYGDKIAKARGDVNTGGQRSVCVIPKDESNYSNFLPSIKIPKHLNNNLGITLTENNLGSSYRVLITNLLRNEYIVFPKSKYSTDPLLRRGSRKHTVNLKKIWTLIHSMEELGLVEVLEYNHYPTVKLLVKEAIHTGNI